MKNRFKIDEPQQGLYIVEDTVSGLLCMFEKGKFNETQEFRNIPHSNPMQIPTLMREVGDWLAENHRDKLF